jgi:hypothetical protein
MRHRCRDAWAHGRMDACQSLHACESVHVAGAVLAMAGLLRLLHRQVAARPAQVVDFQWPARAQRSRPRRRVRCALPASRFHEWSGCAQGAGADTCGCRCKRGSQAPGRQSVLSCRSRPVFGRTAMECNAGRCRRALLRCTRCAALLPAHTVDAPGAAAAAAALGGASTECTACSQLLGCCLSAITRTVQVVLQHLRGAAVHEGVRAHGIAQSCLVRPQSSAQQAPWLPGAQHEAAVAAGRC